MSVAQTIRQKLIIAFKPSRIEVRDESHLHAGHAGARPEGESHFRILVVSQEFEGLTRVHRHRRVYDALKEEFDGPVHALAMNTLAPGELGDTDETRDAE